MRRLASEPRRMLSWESATVTWLSAAAVVYKTGKTREFLDWLCASLVSGFGSRCGLYSASLLLLLLLLLYFDCFALWLPLLWSPKLALLCFSTVQALVLQFLPYRPFVIYRIVTLPAHSGDTIRTLFYYLLNPHFSWHSFLIAFFI